MCMTNILLLRRVFFAYYYWDKCDVENNFFYDKHDCQIF